MEEAKKVLRPISLAKDLEEQIRQLALKKEIEESNLILKLIEHALDNLEWEVPDGIEDAQELGYDSDVDTVRRSIYVPRELDERLAQHATLMMMNKNELYALAVKRSLESGIVD